MPKYRVAVIGRTGKGAYGHGLDTVWLKCDRAEVVAVADENEAGGGPPPQRPHPGGAVARFPALRGGGETRVPRAAPPRPRTPPPLRRPGVRTPAARRSS